MMGKRIQYWAAKAQYPEKDEFYFGNVMLPLNSSYNEVETAVRDLWHSISPHPPPRLIPVPGHIILSDLTKIMMPMILER